MQQARTLLPSAYLGTIWGNHAHVTQGYFAKVQSLHYVCEDCCLSGIAQSIPSTHLRRWHTVCV